MAKAPAPKKKPLTKSQLYANLAEATGLKKSQIVGVMEALTKEIEKSLSKSGAGSFTIPGLVKLVTKKKPATPARTMPKPGSPGETVNVPAKPASITVRVRALKSLKAMV